MIPTALLRLRLLGPALALLLASGMHAQEQFGLVHGNWSGPDALGLDPTRSAGQWPHASVRLAGADVFLWNDLVALNGDAHSLAGELGNGMQGRLPANVVLRASLQDEMKHGFVAGAMPGPAFTMSIGRAGFGLSLRTRSLTSVTGLSPHTGAFLFHGLGHRPQHGERRRDEHLRATSAAWTELSANYAHVLHAAGFGLLKAGASIRYQIAHAGAALRFDVLDYTVVDTLRAEVHEVSGAYGMVLPQAFAGSGWGADLGVSYERTEEEADRYRPHAASGGCTPMHYRYRIALSLLDLGGMRFTDAVGATVRSGSLSIPDHGALGAGGLVGFDSLYAAAGAVAATRGLRIGNPTAVALVYDQRVMSNTYVGLAMVQQVSGRRGDRLRRPNSLAITPRFDTRWFEAAVPIVLHEYGWRRPSVGLMLRFSDLVVGSDHVLPFVFRPDVDAVDLYVRVRITIQRSPFCKGRRKPSRGHRPGSQDALPCMLP